MNNLNIKLVEKEHVEMRKKFNMKIK